MGGHIRQVIREENGNVISRIAYTGEIDCMINSPEFARGEFGRALANFMENESSEDRGAHDTHLVPHGYGIVVLDLLKKKVHSMSGYNLTGHELYHTYHFMKSERVLSTFGEPNLQLAYHGENELIYQDIDVFYGTRNPLLICEINKYFDSLTTDGSIVDINIDIAAILGISPEDVSKLGLSIYFKEHQSFPRFMYFTTLNSQGFEIFEYDKLDSSKLLSQLLADGFSVSVPDLEDWDHFAKEMADEYGEEEPEPEGAPVKTMSM